jgi:ATP-binding cassette subfamily B protein
MRGSRLSILNLLRPHWAALWIGLLAVLAEALADVLEPWPLKIVVDSLLQSRKLPDWADFLLRPLGQDKLAVLNFAVAAVAAIAVVGAVSSYVQRYLSTSISQRVMHDLRRMLYNHIQRLSLAEHERARTGDMITRVTSDIGALQDLIPSALLGIVLAACTLAGMIAVMFYVSWRLTLLALAVAPVLFLVVHYYTRRIKKAARTMRDKTSELVSLVQEVLTSIRLVKAFAREEYEQERFESHSLESVEAALQARSIKAKLQPLVQIIVACGTCLVLGYGARLVLAGELSAGVLIVFLWYLTRMYKPMRDLSKITDTVTNAMVGYERVREVLEIDSRPRDLQRAHRALKLSGAIEFDRVSFGYDGAAPVLKDVSFRIEPGRIAAIVGPSGTGKTTIISLIARFYDPCDGRVKIDGVDVRRFKVASLREQLGFVLQDTILFRTTIWQNIGYGNPSASRSEIIRAAKLANAHDFIETMPDGYDTVVAERGMTLSGGQRQRIAIARAVVRNAPILILDEPTVGLDAAAERAVLEALHLLMAGRTTVFVAHRLSTIRHADRIFVIQDCELVEQGTHEELLARGGWYARTYRLQEMGTSDEVELADPLLQPR